MKVKTFRLYGDIVRRDDAERIVEGYVFVNEDPGDGVRLTRAAMEAATDDYMRWGAVREMHGRTAAGTCEALVWDDKGALIRVKVVDDQAWEKVKTGVYKGFSVGVKPEVVRGREVTKCKWVENSLVDRPVDPDAVIMLHRAEYAPFPEEVEAEEEAVGRRMFAEATARREKYVLGEVAFGCLAEVLAEIQETDSEDKEQLIREACLEFADTMVGLLNRGEQVEIVRIEDVESLRVNGRVAVERAEKAEADAERLASEIERLEAEIEEARAEIGRLSALPDLRQHRPMMVTAAGLVHRVEDAALQNEAGRAKAVARLNEILARASSGEMSDKDRDAAFLEIESLKRSL